MSSGPVFRPDLYRGTAEYYDRYRRPYPAALIDDLCDRAAPSSNGRLLDVACGPGTVTFALCDRFGEVWAVDQEPDAIEFGARKANELGIDNIRWSTGRAEDLDVDAAFDLVTIGNAFHRLDRPRVARRAARWLRPGGHLAVLWSETPMQGAEPWKQPYADAFSEWIERVGATDRLPADLEEHLATPHEVVVREAGFAAYERHEFEHDQDWTIESLIGFVYSTSLLPKAVLGDRAAEFEADLRARLGAIEPSGVFRERASFAYDLARR